MAKYYRSYQVYQAWVGKKWCTGGRCVHIAANSFDEALVIAKRWASELEHSPELTKIAKVFDEVVYSDQPMPEVISE